MRGPGGARALQRPVWCMSTFNYKVYPLLQDLLSITRSTFKFNFLCLPSINVSYQTWYAPCNIDAQNSESIANLYKQRSISLI